jgi:hypothetical protein
MPNAVPVTSSVTALMLFLTAGFYDLTQSNRHVTGNTGLGINGTLYVGVVAGTR